MAWPPPVLPTTRTNTTVMTDTHPAEHNAVNLAINDIVARINPTAWTAVTFQGAWVNQGGANQVCQYRRVADIVYMRGLATSGVATTNLTILPAGFRPPTDIYLAGMGATNVLVVIKIDANGQVQPQTNPGWVSLFQVAFAI